MDIIFVGQNPSRKNLSQFIPFVGTRSYVRLTEWIKYLNIQGNIHILNFTDDYQNPKLSYENMDKFGLKFCDLVVDLEMEERPYRVIALGKIAEKVLTTLNIPHFTLPHPSGLNRKVNDKRHVAIVLNLCYDFIHGGS